MNLKLIGVNVIALSLLAGVHEARADDVSRPIHKTASTKIPDNSWTGFYLGANAGFGFGDTTDANGLRVAGLNVVPRV